MTDPDPDPAAAADAAARRLAQQSLAAADPTGWFDQLYRAAADGRAIIPWDRGEPHPMFLTWAATNLPAAGSRALVVGCGTGENAELLADRGLVTTAFDISPAAIAAARARFPQSQVRYLVADLLAPPTDWEREFDLVVEVFTVQALPRELHATAIANTGRLVGPAGTLLVLTSAADAAPTPESGPPWPLTRDELDSFATDGLGLFHLDTSAGPTGGRRWLAQFTRRPAASPAT